MNEGMIYQKIYEIRGQNVMLDFDLAELYKVETKAMNQAIKRNLDRFPADFMFKLTKAEWDTMRSQFVTASMLPEGKDIQHAIISQSKRNVSAIPYALTEHGITMLASILRSERAVKMNIAIVRAFIALRKATLENKNLTEKLEQLRQDLYGRLGEYDTQLKSIYDAIENLLEENAEIKKWDSRVRIGFKN